MTPTLEVSNALEIERQPFLKPLRERMIQLRGSSITYPKTSSWTRSLQKGRTLEEIVRANFKNVPAQEWNRLPDDLIDRLDEYLYGVRS